MSFRNRDSGKKSRVNSRGPTARRPGARLRRDSRRGVLLLVVLSLLVLFMLIGTAFLMSSNQYRNSAKASAKLDRVGSPPTKLLDRALMQVLCDTGNQTSVIRYHSLLRDLYGSEGFEAMAYSPIDSDVVSNFPNGNVSTQVSRYATPTFGAPTAGNLGPTQGQLIDIYVREHAFRRDDRLIFGTEPLPGVPDARNIIKLERGPSGLPEMYSMPITKGYFNGCLLTITSGPARGQSTRIVDFEYIGDITTPAQTATSAPSPFQFKANTRLFRFRVMAFPNAQGGPLLTRNQLPTTDSRRSTGATRGLEIADLVAAETKNGTTITGTTGATFIVNGRPFNGTGAGFNELAKAGEPRLTAYEKVGIAPTPIVGEVALLPNSANVLISDPANSGTDVAGVGYLATPGDPTTWSSLNPTSIAAIDRPLRWKYQTFVGPGDADESYDAPDFQNMFLALQTVTPRSRARVVQGDPTNPVTLEVDAAAVNASQFLRLDLEDVPIPSYHRPDLINFWYHRLASIDTGSGPMVTNESVQAVLAPYGPDGIRNNGDDPTDVDLETRDQIVAMKRKFIMRPLREDHPNFDGSNPASRPQIYSNPLVRNNNIAVPFWEATGPWDVDNDTDGVPDSVWVDLGDPVAQAEDGTLYKPLYAFLIVDLDSRLNVNAHGLVDDLTAPGLDANLAAGGPGDLAQDISLTLSGTPSINTSNKLPHGLGYGAAEVSLRPLFSSNLPGNATYGANVGNPGLANIQNANNIAVNADDYARILIGRTGDSSGPPVWGRHGLDPAPNLVAQFPYKAAPGITSTSQTVPQMGPPGIQTQMKFFGHPWYVSQYFGVTAVPSAFSSASDFMSRYAIGLDYTGQPVNEMTGETADRPLLANTSYELDLSGDRRREVRTDGLTMRLNYATGETEYYVPGAAVRASATAGVAKESDDAPFATSDLERILRAHDADSGILPDRLWNVVDAFDPLKLAVNQPAAVNVQALATFGSTGDPERLAAAQKMAGINRHLVTTDSYDLPVPGANILSRLTYGADGQPGIAGDDDNDSDGDGEIVGDTDAADEPAELGWGGTDDWYPVMNAITASGLPPAVKLVPDHPTIVDLLRYRAQYERRKRGLPNYSEAQLTLLTQQFLAPELLAGQKMDLNRPFGDGKDNGNGIDDDGDGVIDEAGEPGDLLLDGVVDDPLEAGDPFVDSNNSPNGLRDPGEFFYDIIGGNGELIDDDAKYNGPRDQLWQGLTSEPIGFSYNHGGVVTDGRLTDVNNDGDFNDPDDGRLRYNGTIQRQTMARHLYCLMMLLVDENYIASQNVAENAEGNINLKFFYYDLRSQIAYELANQRGRAPKAPDLVPTPLDQDYIDAEPTAKLLALRKLTARRIAQWAVNCVDFRDADANMTPFEYDENPFDGWGIYGPGNTFGAIDGDAGTNENWGNDVLYPKKYDRTKAINSNPNSVDYNLANDADSTNTTRGLVWGVERPELLITETLALHDRRCTDEEDTGAVPPNLSIFSRPSPGQEPDYDLDQRLKPRGSMFLELYNPWSADGERPAELYGQVDVEPGNRVRLSDKGVMLNRLSTIGATAAPGVSKRSPVWRVAVVQDPINGRLANQIVDIAALSSPAGANDREAVASQFLTTDVDGFGFNSDKNAQRLIYFTTGRDYTTGIGSDINRDNDNDVMTEYSNIANGVVQVNNPNLNVWVPPLPVRQLATVPGGYPHPYVPAAHRYFIARKQRRPVGSPTPDDDVAIAPILPGRYAVVGSSGVQLDVNDVAGPAAGVTKRFVTPISRLMISGSSALDPEQSDSDHLNPTNLLRTRRIELWPNLADFDSNAATVDPQLDINVADPEMQQLLVGENAGPEIVRRNGTMIDPPDPYFVNVTDSDSNERANPNPDYIPNGVPDGFIVQPAVAIPVEDMNISEPVEGYPSPRYVEMFQNPTLNPSGTGGVLNIQEAKLNADGELAYDTPYNRPLDLDDVLVRNGTTPNFRSVHLQRLANPMFPWNPPKYDEDGKKNDMHRPELPINPYLTIDSQSTDLTAYNGASQLERTDLPVATPPGMNPPNNRAIPTEDLTQGDYFAPLSAGEYLQAPDHVLAGLIEQLSGENPPIVPQWTTVAAYRGTGGPADETRIASDLTELERLREGDMASRNAMDAVTEWGWHRLRRVLPDDTNVAPAGTYTESEFKQRLNLKSLERGAHYLQYYKYPQPGSPEGWWFDTRWTPRLLWKQERPNAMLFLRGATGGTVRATDLKNARSRRMLMQRTANIPRQEDHFTPDDDTRNQYLVNNLQLQQHVIDFALEQTLGFANDVYAPELDRSGRDEVAVLKSTSGDPKPGAPEVLTNSTTLVAPHVNELNPWNTIPEQKVLLTPDVTGGAPGELQRREKLMKSTYPWLTWNNRPYISAEELTQVPASSSSLMLREYSVANRYTANPSDGDGLDSTGSPETTIDRLARQQGAYGHLLNFFQAASMPAGTYSTPTGTALEPLAGGPNYFRILDFVEVPSRFVGTDTLLSPETFNDVPSYIAVTEPVGTNITGLDDPRLLLQPPFNKISRQRDPGRVNLNTVTGRRQVESSGFIRHWSEVYDGIMHRYGDSNLMDPSVVLPNPPQALQLSHFGPAWRDVELSRRGYAQFNAAPVNPADPLTPIEKLVDTQNQPETFAFGLNKDFPSVFSNPFRSADAGDLVPIPSMVRPGVEATWLRGIHWQRAFEPSPTNNDVLITNPFASQTAEYAKVAWGVADYDDDGNGIKDDIREAGYGIIEDPPTVDGDTLRVRPSLNNALEGSGIPLFSEQLPEPAIDAERNPGMMYQPMTRLGNLVTNRSNVYAIWVTVGYFEVDRAPDWSQQAVRERFGGTTSDTAPATIRARALYDRVYPDGYTLGEELGTDTGSTNRQRAFYIIDRSEPVGFKPGEDLNVDKMIRVRRRIE